MVACEVWRMLDIQSSQSKGGETDDSVQRLAEETKDGSAERAQ